jgi:hypothetical protein
MNKHDTFKITVLNFYKHNPKNKKSFNYFMVAKNYFHDHKIAQLTPNESQLFLYCCAISCDMASNQIAITVQSIPKQFRISSKSLLNHLERLQQLQLVTFEKTSILKNRIEENRIEENRIEVLARSKPIEKPNKDLNRKIWETFKDAYFLRYKIEPLRNASVNSKISQLAKRLGQDAIEVVKFYLAHNEKFYVQKMHDIGFCLKDAESLYTQFKRGRPITSIEVNSFVNEQRVNDIDAAVERGGL